MIKADRSQNFKDLQWIRVLLNDEPISLSPR
jgi:hypothetical protein